MRFRLSLVTGLYLLSAAVTTYAGDVIEESPSGHINWTQGVISAQGYGTYPQNVSMPAQRRLLARRAAIVDGQRNLLEMTKGVRLTSMTKVVDMMVENSTTATRVEGLIKGAVPGKESYQNDIYVVTMTMPIGGKLLQEVYQPAELAVIGPRRKTARARVDQFIATSLGHLVGALVPTASATQGFVIQDQAEADTARRILEWIQRQEPATVAAQLEGSINDFERNTSFSGLLIDATAVPHFEMATVPNIRDEEGNVIYPNQDTSYDDIVNKRGVTYDLDLQDAVRNKRVATTPFVVNALNTYKNLNSDLVISKEDAKRIVSSPGT
ncbi:MAG: hypothetical protein WD994_03890, partial [Pseudomonadales bacterium]